MRMTNEEIAERFARLALLLEIRGDDPYRIRSYKRAAETIRDWPTPLEQIAREKGEAGLQEIPGIGRAISAKIMEIIERGTFDAWERLIQETPASVLDLLLVEGIGPKTASTLYKKFKIETLDDLVKFVEGGGLEMVDGITPQNARKIKKSLAEIGKQREES